MSSGEDKQTKGSEYNKLLEKAIEDALRTSTINRQSVEWFKQYSKALAAVLRAARESKEANEWFKAWVSKETNEYAHEELKWIRYMQVKSKEYDEVVKKKDELARSVKEGKIDLDLAIKSAGEGVIGALVTLFPVFEFGFRSFKPPWWERLFVFLFRRQLGANLF